jgi:hypothetical protein
MAQLVSILFFSAALVGALALVADMLRDEWDRVIAVLGGEALDRARATSNAPVRVKMRAWNLAESRPASPQRRAAA